MKRTNRISKIQEMIQKILINHINLFIHNFAQRSMPPIINASKTEQRQVVFEIEVWEENKMIYNRVE